ncbi:MAG: aminodeoxychorismate/anthranilate synthase component II [Chloroflexi bacterium]|nr:aminodeoxychorismate/anthranilate synthase component II [Chloroflexota bacterium]
MILVVDNYDSFTFNLVQALETAGADLLVVRNDRIGRDAIETLADRGLPGRPLRAILVSPGPGNPDTAGVSTDAIRVAAGRGVPMLGVCLGMQCLAAVFGGAVVRAPSLVHGEASAIEHAGVGLLAGIPSPFAAGRYHSLCVDESTLPADIEVTAHSADGVVMALRHRSLPLEGVQFHPESVLTPEGPRVLANFLRLAGEGEPEVLDEAAAASFATRGMRRPAGRRGQGEHPGASGVSSPSGSDGPGAARPATLAEVEHEGRIGTEVTAR